MIEEQKFGGIKESYGVIEQPNGRIKVRVYHSNAGVHKIIRANAGNPRYFLRYEGFSGYKPRAEHHLAQVVHRYRRYFERELVDFELR